MFCKVCCYLSVISLLHAAYSAAQHRSYRRLTLEQDVLIDANSGGLLRTDLPIDIVLQTIISSLLILIIIVVTSGSFQEIRTLDELNRKPQDLFDNQPSLYHFNHRGRILR